jgi:ankyrin repeat protein
MPIKISLGDAINSGSVETLKETLRLMKSNHMEYSSLNSSTWQAMLVTAMSGRTDMVKLLLENGAKEIDCNVDGWTALHIAAQKNDLELAQLLLAGKVISAKKVARFCLRNKPTALHLAAQYGSLEVAKLILEKGEKEMMVNQIGHGKTPLQCACLDRIEVDNYVGKQCTALEMVKLLVENDAEVNALSEGGYNVAYFLQDDDDVFEYLLKKGMEVNRDDDKAKHGYTPLHFACIAKKLGVVNKLLKCEGIIVAAQDDNGDTPLLYAVKFSTLEIVNHLYNAKGARKRGAKTLTVDELLFASMLNRNSKIAEFFIGQKANVNFKNMIEPHETPLHLATTFNELQLVKTLLKNGAQIDAVDDAGQTPLHYACVLGFECVLPVLYNQDVINKQDKTGLTALHLAAIRGHIDCVKWLLKHGADKNITSKDGSTPEKSAIKYKRQDVVVELQNSIPMTFCYVKHQ